MDFFKQRRKHSLIDKLPEDIKGAVDKMLQADFTYAEVADYIKDNGFEISVSSIHRYAKTLNATVQSIRMISENFRVLTEEIAKYPQLDTTEAIIRIMSHQMLERIQNMTEDELKTIDPVDIFKQTTALVRAASYKQKSDLQIKSEHEAGYEQVKVLVFEAMAKENPELYGQVSKFLEEKKTETA